jgi:hypothetical protein
MSDAIVVTKGERTNLFGSEIFVAIHCQECGQRITEAESANVTVSRDTQPGERQSFRIVCLDCDRHRDAKNPASWTKLYEFIETLADSVEMKAERKSKG